MYAVYHPKSDMDTAWTKLESTRQRGMDAQDYAEWIKYLSMLAIPPHCTDEEVSKLDDLEVRKFVLTLDSGEERTWLARQKFTNIQGALNSLEEYHLIQAGPDGFGLSNRIVGRENNPH